MTKTLQFLSLVFTALALIPSGAHFFEMPHKLDLAQDQYFVVQGIYAGWAYFGIVLISAIIVDLVLAFLLRGQQTPALLALAAGVLMAITLATFFIWIFPANQATENWTMISADWDTLRSQWERTHAVNAVLTFIAFCALSLSTILRS